MYLKTNNTTKLCTKKVNSKIVIVYLAMWFAIMGFIYLIYSSLS